jgi:hypothetical protein
VTSRNSCGTRNLRACQKSPMKGERAAVNHTVARICVYLGEGPCYQSGGNTRKMARYHQVCKLFWCFPLRRQFGRHTDKSSYFGRPKEHPLAAESQRLLVSPEFSQRRSACSKTAFYLWSLLSHPVRWSLSRGYYRFVLRWTGLLLTGQVLTPRENRTHPFHRQNMRICHGWVQLWTIKYTH